MGCYGDGGAVFTNDDDIAALIRSLCVHGKSELDKYNNLRLGMNSRLDTIQAAVLDVKLSAFEDYELKKVNAAAKMYTERLDGKLDIPVVPEGFYSSWAQYTVQLPDREKRDRVQAGLRERGIPSMIYYPKCMHQQGAFEKLPYRGGLPCIRAALRQGPIPAHAPLSDRGGRRPRSAARFSACSERIDRIQNIIISARIFGRLFYFCYIKKVLKGNFNFTCCENTTDGIYAAEAAPEAHIFPAGVIQRCDLISGPEAAELFRPALSGHLRRGESAPGGCGPYGLAPRHILSGRRKA